jgi:hypothetical protein
MNIEDINLIKTLDEVSELLSMLLLSGSLSTSNSRKASILISEISELKKNILMKGFGEDKND